MSNILTPSAQADLIREYLKANGEKLVWSEMQNFQVPAGYEQQDWQEILNDMPIHAFEEAGNCRISGYHTTKLADIGTRHNGKHIAVEGKVVSLSEREPDPKTIKWLCLRCGSLNEPAKFGRQPLSCHAVADPESGKECGNDSFDIEITEDTKDMRAIRIQQDNHTLSVVVRDEAILDAIDKSGKPAYAFGVMVFEPYIDRQTKKAKFRKYLEAVNIECDDKTIDVTPQDIERFKADMAQPMFYERVLSSIAPHIHGMEAAKESGMLALASIGMRKPARMLWIGDPGVGKSELMEYFTLLSGNGHYATMANTRQTGLTTTSEKDEDTGKWMVTLGVMGWADLLCLDEFQAIDEKTAMALNDVVESCKIRYALAGGNYGEIAANCAMILSCNPYQGKVFKDENIREILKFLKNGASAFITRMTLIYFFRDVVDATRDRLVGKAVAKNSGNNPLEAYEQDWIDEQGVEHYGTQSLRKLFAYISTIPVEALPAELHDELVEHYVKSRADVVNNTMKLMGPRFLRDAIKLAQLIARVQGESKPSAADIEKATNLLKDHMEAAAFDPETKEIDVNLLTGSKPQKELKKEKSEETVFWEEFENLRVLGMASITLAMWVQSLVAKGWKQEKAESMISKAEQAGKIMGVPHDIKRL